MESFVRHQNVERYLQLLATTTDASERQRATKLLAKERQNRRTLEIPETQPSSVRPMRMWRSRRRSLSRKDDPSIQELFVLSAA